MISQIRKFFPEVKSSFYLLKGKIGRICENNKANLYVFLEKYSDLIGNVSILALDTFYLLGEIFSYIPKKLTHLAFCSINFVGLISLPFYCHAYQKSVNDMMFAQKMGNDKIFYFTLLKIFLTASNILLLLCCSFAAIARTIDLSNITNIIYLLTKPWGSFCLITMMGMDLFRYQNNKKILYELKKLNLFEVDKLLLYFISPQKQLKNSFYQKNADIHESIDKDTWKIFMNKLITNQNNIDIKQRLFQDVLIKNLETQQMVSASDLALKILGYVAIFFSNLYIGTFIQAGIWTSMSFLYTVQLIFQKIKQAKQQKIASKFC